MPRHFAGRKDYIKKTRQFQATHPLVKTQVQELKVRQNFFEQIHKLMTIPQQQQPSTPAALDGTLPHHPCNNKDRKPAMPQGNPALVVVPKSSMTHKSHLRPNFSSMAQYNLSNEEQLPQTGEGVQVLTLKDYLQAVEAGKIPKGLNHHTLVELTQKPQQLNETKVIVLSYNDTPVNPVPHKST